MFISRICISNFRNFHKLDVKLGPTAVIVGENSAGKSNLLFALRLILDPRMADSTRQLREEDFWDGLADPVENKEIIEIAVDFQDFKKDKNILTVLQQFCIKESVQDTARLSYRYRPRAPLPKDRKLTTEDYEFVVFGGDDEKNRISYDDRRWIPIEVLPALRDAESDLSAWRQSPLRPLIEQLKLPTATLDSVAKAIDLATGQLLAENDVQQLTTNIEDRLSKMVGRILSVDPSLGFAPTIPDRLARSLRMFGDGAKKRSVGELSLGVNNVLYLLLLAIELERKEAASERATTILAIEEPEAHLHPHLQRLVFRDFLRRESPVILTTHSPQIASVSPLHSLMLLREDRAGDGSKGTSTQGADFTTQETEDLERYLDATRAEILFSRGVILVEGASEIYLVPAIATKMKKSLDEYGVTVCSVHGTDFAPYAKLLGPNGLNIPFVILTDGDWYTSRVKEILSRGLRRAVSIAETIASPVSADLAALFESRRWDELYEGAASAGIFVGAKTLEVDLFDSGHGQEFVETFKELKASTGVISAIEAMVNAKTQLTGDNIEILLTVLKRFGKGRIAQRFAGKVDIDRCPDYIKAGIDALVGRVSP